MESVCAPLPPQQSYVSAHTHALTTAELSLVLVTVPDMEPPASSEKSINDVVFPAVTVTLPARNQSLVLL